MLPKIHNVGSVDTRPEIVQFYTKQLCAAHGAWMAMSEPADVNNYKQNVPNPRVAAEAIEKCPVKNTTNGKIINKIHFTAL